MDQSTRGVGLKKVVKKVHDARTMDKVYNSTKYKGKEREADAHHADRQKARRQSVDTGPADWPNARHVGVEAPPIRNTNLSQLVEEIGDLEVCFPLRPINPPKLQIGEKPPIPPMHILKVHLPTATELAEFPESLSVHLKEVGMETLRVFLHPMILFRQKMNFRLRLSTDRQIPVPPVSTEFVSKLPLLKNWPTEALERIVKSMKLRCYEPKEFVVYEREPASAIFILVSGTVQLLTRKGTKTLKRYNSDNTATAQTSTATVAFGELSLLTDEPWLYAIKTVTKADFWLLTKPEFTEIMHTIPHHIMHHSIHTAFQRRNETMKVNFPIDANSVKSHATYENVSHEFAKDLVDRLEPHAIPRNYTLAKTNDPANAVFFLRHGAVAVYRIVDGVETLVQTLTPNSVLNEVAVAHGSTCEATYKTTVESDVYRLSKAAFLALSRQYPLDLDVILDAARSQRQAELYSNHLRFRELVAAIPIVRDVLPHYYVKDFVKLLHPRSIRPLSSVCSTATFCDRILILTKGKIRLGKNHTMKIGDSIGFTCCVPHRWGNNALTLDATVEVLEIGCQGLMSFLDEKGLLAEVIHRSKVVMFPNAFSLEESRAIKDTLPKGSFPMYPVSLSRSVNLNEMGFCTVHMPLLAEVQREEKERQQAVKDDTPAPYKQLSQGVWIPTQRNIRGFTTSLKQK